MFKIAPRIRRHLADPDSRHRQIVLGMIWVSLFLFIGKLAGAAKEMALAWRYGVSATVDAYVFVFSLISWPVSVWASALTVVLVPLATRLRQDGSGELLRFRSELLGLTLLFGVGTGLLAWWGLPRLLMFGWMGLSGTALLHALDMVGSMAILVPLGMVIGLFSAWMLAAGYHQNTLLEAIPALVLLFALVVPTNWIPNPLILGTVAGFAIHAIALLVRLRQRGDLGMPSYVHSSPAWQYFWGSMGIVAAGQILMGLTNLIDQFFAANLGTGALSTLSYVNRVLALILGLGATAISRATLPVFSAVHAEVPSGTNALALRWAAWMFVLGAVIMSIGWAAAPKLVELLFQRGAFTEIDSARVSELLQYALFQTPFYFASVCLVVNVSARQKYSMLMYLGGLGLLIKLGSVWYLSQSFELAGIVISQGLIYLTNTVVLCIYVRHAGQNNAKN